MVGTEIISGGRWRKKFIASKAWQQTRAIVIQRDAGVCQECGQYVVGPIEVHHKIELTEQNYTDPAISLNPELLEVLHHECHDARHNRFGGARKATIVDDELNIDYAKRGP